MTDRPIIKRGDTFPHPSDGGTVKVMTVSDGYADVLLRLANGGRTNG